MTKSFGMSLDLVGLSRTLQADAQVIAEATRPAAKAGSQVLYEAVLRNVATIRSVTGNLKASIYQVHADEDSGKGRSTYYTSWRTSKKSGLPRAPHGHLVEFGYLQRYVVTKDPKTGRFYTHKDKPLPTPVQVPARPFVRPAVALQPKALEAAERRFLEVLKERGVTR